MFWQWVCDTLAYGIALCAAILACLGIEKQRIRLPDTLFYEAGGEGSRTPVLDTVDASISMFRRRLAALTGGPLCVSLPHSQEPVDVVPCAVPPQGTSLLS